MPSLPNLPCEHPGRGVSLLVGAGPVAASAELGGTGEVVVAEPEAGRWTAAAVDRRIIARLGTATPAGHLVVADAHTATAATADRMLLAVEAPAGNWHVWLCAAPTWAPSAALRGRIGATYRWQTDPATLAAAQAAHPDDPALAAQLARTPDRVGDAANLLGGGLRPDPEVLLSAAARLAGAADWRKLTPATRPAALAALSAASAATSARWALLSATTGSVREAAAYAASAQVWAQVRAELAVNIPAKTVVTAALARTPPVPGGPAPTPYRR